MGEIASLKRKERDKQKQDDFVMGTNNSSIVSKRSVEKLYFPNEPQLFRFFVKRFQRRAPLINRGYWLRMHAVKHVLQRFLEGNSQQQSYVINLGCGYDPLPFRLLLQNQSAAQDTVFIDVDYPKLMRTKCDIVQQTPSLRDTLEDLQIAEVETGVLLRSKSYIAIGCDLCQIDLLVNSLEEAANLEHNAVLFIAEVSLTYMNYQDADAIIQWASKIDNAQFCLLEQFLPNGPTHPFAVTMLKHFEKIQTPLKSIDYYPSKESQCKRFLRTGWSSIEFKSLWEIWQDETCVSTRLRQELDDIELFDEWEEFALFACHYFVLVAIKSTSTIYPPFNDTKFTSENDQTTKIYYPLSFTGNTSDMLIGQENSYRRFAAAMDKGSMVVVHGGIGKQKRETSLDIYELADNQHPNIKGPLISEGIACHTVTRFNFSQFLLVGGRTSPDKASSHTWRYDGKTWNLEGLLIPGRFRHSAVAISGKVEADEAKIHENEGVLVFGGRTGDGTILGEWAFWRSEFGWKQIKANSQDDISYLPRFGASMFRDADSNSGWLFGGIGEHRLVHSDVWHWTFDARYNTIDLVNCTSNCPYMGPNGLDRFGASIGHAYEKHQLTVIAGGIGRRCLPDTSADVLLANSNLNNCDIQGKKILDTGIKSVAVDGCILMIGTCIISPSSNTVLIMGGGAVCFSFGTYWNKSHVVRLDVEQAHASDSNWRLSSTNVPANYNSFLSDLNNSPERSEPEKRDQVSTKTSKSVPRLQLKGKEDFLRIIASNKPVTIEQADIGSCIEKWTVPYLKQAIGAERKIVAHTSKTANMDFRQKNFEYVTMTFEDFINQVEDNQLLYMRAVSSERTAKPTDLATDFPTIANDFRIPHELSYALTNFHSSPLRISGPIRMWLHYDVMANILCQIHGTKRIRLFPPSAHTKLGFKPGSTTSSLNIFQSESDREEGGKKVSKTLTEYYEAILRPGDILYIPPLWPHAVDAPDHHKIKVGSEKDSSDDDDGDDKNTSADAGAGDGAGSTTIAVNVFFRSFKQGKYAPGKDIYGNRDVQAYEQGRQGIARIAKAFEGLPGEVRKFYIERLAGELFDLAGEDEDCTP